MNIKTVYYLLTSSRSFCIQIVFTLNAIYYVSQVGLNPLQLILLGTIMELAVLLFEIPTGLIADIFGRKKSIIIGTLIIGSAHLLEGTIPTFWAVAIGAALWGIGWTFISGAETAWIADEMENKDLDSTLLNGAKYSSLGSFLGILTSVVIAVIFTVQIAIILAGVFLIVLAILSSKMIVETKFITIARDDSSNFEQMKGALRGSLTIIKSNKILLSLAVITLFMGLASEGFDRLWGAHFIEGFKMNEEESVYWFGAFYAIAFLLNIGVLKIVETYVKERFAIVLVLLNSLLVIVMIYFATAEQFLIAAILYWGIASLRAVNYPLVSVMTNKQLRSQGRATTLSMYGQLDAFGQVAGGPLVGVLALYTSVQGGIITSAILIIPTVYFLWKLRKIA